MIAAGRAEERKAGLIRQTWESGGRGERAVLVAFVLGLGLMPVLLGVVILLPSSTFPPTLWHQLGIATAIAGFSITSVYPAIFDAMATARYLRAMLGTAEYLTPLQREYLSEWARTKEVLGVNGQFRGSVVIGLVYATLYFGLFFGAFPYVVLLFPHLGDLTAPSFAAFVIPTFVALYFFSFRRSRRIVREATARGLRLEELRKQMRPRLRRAKQKQSF